MTTISLKLPERLLRKLETESQNRKTSKSEIIRECLEQGLAGPSLRGEPSCFDLAQDLAGQLKGLPPDLATNPRHLEGFG